MKTPSDVFGKKQSNARVSAQSNAASDAVKWSRFQLDVGMHVL